MKPLHVLLCGLGLWAGSAHAEDPAITDVSVRNQGMVWTLSVSISHPDTGWEHYADGWEILDSGGNRLGYRKLMHPHVEEQPFTRSLSGLVFPDGTREIFIRASCSRHGWSDDVLRVDLSP